MKPRKEITRESASSFSSFAVKSLIATVADDRSIGLSSVAMFPS